MPELDLQLNGDNCWPELREPMERGEVLHGELVGAAFLDHGMVGGAPSVTLRIRLDNGKTVLAETSLRIYMAAAAGFRGAAERAGFHDFWRG